MPNELKNNKYVKYVGYKFYKFTNKECTNVDMIRVIRVYDNNSFKILLEDGSTKTVPVTYLKDYTPLEPNGLATFNILLSGETFDVMVAIYKLLDVKIGMTEPYAICRQGVRDFFYDLLCKGDPEIENHYVGVSVSQDSCPTNLTLRQLTACDMAVDTKMVHFYREDTIDDILKCVPQAEFNKVLEKLYTEHLASIKEFNPFYKDRREYDGWCKDLETLLHINNINSDIDSMQGIVSVDFNIDKHIIKDNEFDKLDQEVTLFLSKLYKVNIVDSRVIEYDNSVNLADFNNNNYTMIRDKNKKLYLIVYLVQGEYLEAELEEQLNKLSVTEKLGLTYTNKYKDNKNLGQDKIIINLA